MRKIILFLLLVITITTITATTLFATKIYDAQLENAKYVRTIDGDTFVVNIEGIYEVFGSNLSIRIRGINTPERGQENYKESREVLRELLESGLEISIINLSRDKYFRLGADVYVGDINVAEHMLRHGYARIYGQ